MATSLSACFHPITIVSPASSNHHTIRFKAQAASASGKWWTTLFGLSSNPDYIQSNPVTDTNGSASGNSEPDHSKSRFAPGCFTEEKAKLMRMKMIETANFHDVMYHSAIASCLASDVSGRYDR